MVQFCTTNCSCIAILWVSLVSFAAVILCICFSKNVYSCCCFFRNLFSPETFYDACKDCDPVYYKTRPPWLTKLQLSLQKQNLVMSPQGGSKPGLSDCQSRRDLSPASSDTLTFCHLITRCHYSEGLRLNLHRKEIWNLARICLLRM